MKISSQKAVFANDYLYNKNRLINNHINSTYSTQINKYNDKDRFELQRIMPYKNNISFGSMITPEQEKYCKMIVHGAAAACGSISAAAGKATVVGADAWALRGTQFLMFAYMANYLKIPFMAAVQHAAIEYSQGLYIGYEGSKKIIALASIASEAASGGTSIPVSEGAVRGINGGLSAAVTEKMGRGFIKQVKNGTMTNMAQFQRLVSYFGTKLIFHGFDAKHTIGDLENEEAVKFALKNTPREHKEFLGMLMEHVVRRDMPKATTMFLLQMAEMNVFTKLNHQKVNQKEIAKQAIKNAIITSAVYEIFDIADNALISKAAVDTAIDISENVVNYPEVSQMLDKYADEFYTKMNMDKISSEVFTRQFKNRTFLMEFSNFANSKIRNFARAWERRENQKINQKKAEHQRQINEENKKSKDLEDKNKNIPNIPNQKDIQDILTKENEIYQNLAKSNAFGYSKIAGYDEEKGFLKAYLSSLSDINTCDSEDLVNSILFFGPRGNGKTTFAGAIADEFGMNPLGVPTTSRKDKAYQRLLKKLNEAKKHWENEQRNSIILVDECTAFMTSAKNKEEQEYNEKIAKLIENAASEYHAILFFTTNYPDKIDKMFLDSEKMPIIIPLNPPDNKNALSVFKYYIENDDFDYEKIMSIFNEMCKKYDSKYSNGQIKNMVGMAKLLNNGIINADMLASVIREAKPEITKDDIEYFEKSKEQLKR